MIRGEPRKHGHKDKARKQRPHNISIPEDRVHLGSDGASTFTGRMNGVNVQLMKNSLGGTKSSQIEKFARPMFADQNYVLFPPNVRQLNGIAFPLSFVAAMAFIMRPFLGAFEVLVVKHCL